MIKTIIFDIGKVVVDNHFPELFTNFAKKIGANPEQVLEYNRSNKNKVLLGDITLEQYWADMEDLSGVKGLNLEKIWIETGLEVAEVNTTLLEKIKKLREKYSVGVMTNVSESRLLLDHEINLYDNFDFAIISCREKLLKPDPEIYRLALEEAKAQPEEVIFVDDQDKFILAAKEMAINTVLYKDNETLFEGLAALGVEV